MGNGFSFLGDIMNKYANQPSAVPQQQQRNTTQTNGGGAQSSTTKPVSTPEPTEEDDELSEMFGDDSDDFSDSSDDFSDDFDDTDDDSFELDDSDFDDEDYSDNNTVEDSGHEDATSNVSESTRTNTAAPFSNGIDTDANSINRHSEMQGESINIEEEPVSTPVSASGADFSALDDLFGGLGFDATTPIPPIEPIEPIVPTTEPIINTPVGFGDAESNFNESASVENTQPIPHTNTDRNDTSTINPEPVHPQPTSRGGDVEYNTDVEPVVAHPVNPTPLGESGTDFSFLNDIFNGIAIENLDEADSSVNNVNTATDSALTDIPDDITAVQLLKEFINPNTKYTSVDFQNYARLHEKELYIDLPKKRISWGTESEATLKALDTLGKAHLLEMMNYSPVRKPLITLFLEAKPAGAGLAVALINLYYNVASQMLERLQGYYGRVQDPERNSQLIKSKRIAWGHNRYWSLHNRPDMCINTTTEVQDVIRKNAPVPTNEYSTSNPSKKSANPYDRPIDTRINYPAKDFVRMHTVYKVPLTRFVEYNESYNIMKHLLNNNINWRAPKIEHIYLAGRAHFLEVIGVLPRYSIVTKSRNNYLTVIINAYYTGELEYDTIPSKKLLTKIVGDTLSDGKYWGYSKSDGVGSANFGEDGVEPIDEYRQGIEEAVPVVDTEYSGTADSIKVDKLNGIILNPRRSQQVSLIDAGSVAKPDLSSKGIGVRVRNWMFNSFKGTSYVFEKYWNAILNQVDNLYKGDRRQIKMIAFIEDSVIVGNKFVSVEDLTRGPGGAELCDIIDIRSLFKRYRNLEQIIFDMNCVYCIEEQYAVNSKDGYKSSVKNVFIEHPSLKCIGVLANGESSPSMTYRKDLDLEIAMDEVDIVSDTIAKKRQQNAFRTACANRDPNIREKSPGTLMRISKGTAEHGLKFGSHFFNDLQYDENGKSHPIKALWHGSLATVALGIAGITALGGLTVKGVQKLQDK